MTKEMLMPHDATTEEHLIFNRNAILYLYEESAEAENAEMTRVIGEALAYCDDMLKGAEGNFQWSKDAALYLYFIIAVLEMNPKDLTTFVSLLKWLKLIPQNADDSLNDNLTASSMVNQIKYKVS